MGLLQSKGPKPMKQVYIKPIKQDNSPPPNYGNSDTKSKVSVAEIAFGSTDSARFFTVVTLAVLIVSIFDLIWTLSNYTPDWWNPIISGIITMLTSMTVSALLMISLNRKMNTTVTPLTVQT